MDKHVLCLHIIDIAIQGRKYHLKFLILYQCLDHEHPLLAETNEELIHVDRLLCLDPLQHGVQEDEGASATHPRTAVHQEGNALVFVVGLLYSLDEGDEGGGKPGHTMVWPRGEVVLCH